ncbi:tetratricopeptide repeat protein [Streptomyces bauhiniae]|uniref:tetratricopeptide repeat protein n=1 Tax=Streptomyces bauhiniae TaxID=2340725 RepID=UPI00331D13F9
MEPDTPEALLAVMAACADQPRSAAWQELADLVRNAGRADARLARLWPPQGLGPAAWRQLAHELHDLTLHDADTERAVADYLHRHAAPVAPTAPGTVNVISGEAVLHGPSVQSRDIHGGIHFHPPPPPPRPRPQQLPPLNPRFVGRAQDLRALDELRARHPGHVPQVLVISGLAGAGKSTLATHWLHALESAFPDGLLHADLGGRSLIGLDGPVSPATVLEAFLTALGAPSMPADPAQRSALWRSLTSELRLGVLLDDAVTAEQVRPLLLSAASGLTVVTSRNSLTGLRIGGADIHRLEGLATESALELLAMGGGKRVARERAAAREVVHLCGRLPLAVGLASAQLALRPHRSVSALARSLGHGAGPVDALLQNGEAVIRTALDMSYGLLPPEAAALYRRMGLLPTDRYDLPMLSAVAEEASAQRADTAAHTLVEANLLEETGPGTYGFHALVRSHAHHTGAEQESPEERDHVLSRFVDWCLATAAVAEDILVPSHRLPGHDQLLLNASPTPLKGPEEALAWLDTYRNALMGAVRHCAHAGRHERCWRLTDVMWPLFLRFRPSGIWLEAHRLGLDAARRSGSREGRGRMLTSGAIGLRDAGEYVEAARWYRQALTLATQDGDTRQQAQAINGLGHLALLTHQLDDAREHFEHALHLRESIGYRRGAALSRRRLGETALAADDFSGAVRHLHCAHEELKALGESYEASRVLALLGHALALAQDHEGGTQRLREALTDFRTGGSRSEHWEGRCLEWLGTAAETQGDPTTAGQCYSAARDLFRRLSPTDTERLDDRLRHL